MPHSSYRAITTDSNLEPIAIEMRRGGVLVPLEGAHGTITIKDAGTRAIVVDQQEVVIVHPGRALYTFKSSEVALIKSDATWLVEWRIESSIGQVFRSEPIRLPVLAKL
jgi:hypothetical protein